MAVIYMDSSTISDLIDQLQEPGELNSAVRSKLLEVLHSCEERKVHDNLFKSLTEISKGIVTASNWEDLLNNSFEKLGNGIEADRVSYYEYTFGDLARSDGFELKVEWCSEFADLNNGKSRQSFLAESQFHELFLTLTNHCPFQAITSNLHEGILKSLMLEDGVKTILLLPVVISDTLYGIIRIDTCKFDRVWTEREISLLQPVVFQVRNLLEKRNMETRVHNTYKQAQIGTWEMDLEQNTYRWSKITKEIFELPQDQDPDEEKIESFFADDIHREKLLQAVETAKQTGEPYDMELPIKTAKGNIKWIRDTGQAHIKRGKCTRLYGIVQDIHKRKTAELESEKNKKLLEAITQQTDVAVWVRDKQGRIIFVNKEWKKIFGLDNKNLLGKTVFDFFDKKTAMDLINSDCDVIKRNRQIVFEEYIETARGPRHYMVNKFPLRGIEGLEEAVGGIGTDITEIKNTEEKLQKTEQKLLEIIEHSTNLFYTHNMDHELTYLSPQSVDFLGYSPEDAKRCWTEFLTDHPVNKLGGEITQRAIDSGQAQPPFELQLRKKDGDLIWVEVNEAPILKDGKTISIAGSLTDITKRKKAQEAIKANLKEKNTLLAEIHHRVKNNLAVVASLMQLQAMESENSDLQNQLFESVLRIKSMASIHEHLYKSENFSKLDFGENLKGLVSDIIDTMQYSTHIDLQFDCEEVYLNINQAIPGSLIINEVVTNVIKHGFRGLKQGRILLRLHQHHEQVQLTVEDNGCGFPDDFNLDLTNTLGMQLIKTLTVQLEGSYRYTPLDQGLRFNLQFTSAEL